MNMNRKPVRLITKTFRASQFPQPFVRIHEPPLQKACEQCRKRRRKCTHSTNNPSLSPGVDEGSQIQDSAQQVIPLPTYRNRKRRTVELPIPEEKRICMPKMQVHQLCDECREINFSKILDLDAATLQKDVKGGVLIKVFGSNLEHAAKSSCALCRLFSHSRILPYEVPDSLEYHLRAYSAFNRFNSMQFSNGIPERFKAKDLPCLAVVPVVPTSTNSSFHEDRVRFLFCHSDAYNDKRIFAPQVIPSSIDFSGVASLLKYCQTKHHKLCLGDQTRVSGMKLINCEKDACTPLDLDIVLADRLPASFCYVALSYVWGRSKPQETDLLPQVILDAMIVTRKLEYQFLWVDKYCIDQVNPDEQIRQMNVIYKGADITIIAAAGNDSSFGLPGVGDTPRIAQPTLALGSVQISSSMHSPRYTIGLSTWATRAWTFQEGRLSRRRLVFTEYETYFECNSMYWRESWAAELDPLHSHNRFRKFFDAGIFSGTSSIANRSIVLRTPVKNLQRYYDLASEFSTKEFSQDYGQDDSLKAFTGIMNDLKEKEIPVYQLWGVPLTYSSDTPLETRKSFVASLLWRHKAGVTSRSTKPPQRRSKFPSWSWSGWAGQIIFPVTEVRRYGLFISLVETMSLELDQGPHENVELISLFHDPDLANHQFCYPRALRFDASMLLLPKELTSQIHIIRDTYESPNLTIAGFKAVIYLSHGPDTLRGLRKLFSTGILEFMLMAVEPPLPSSESRRQPYIHFMVIESHKNSASRVGVMVVKADFETFKQNFDFEKRDIRLV